MSINSYIEDQIRYTTKLLFPQMEEEDLRVKNEKNFNYMENIYLQCTNLAGLHIRTKTCYFCTFSMSRAKPLKVERNIILPKWFLMVVQMTLSFIQTF